MSEAAMKTGGCPICGDGDVRLLFQKDEINVCRCHACTFVFAPAESVVAARGTDEEFYSINYFQGREGSGYANYLETTPTLQANARALLQRLQRLSPPKNCLLEIGSGAGHFLQQASPLFERVYGVEICAEICLQPPSSNIRIFPVSVTDLRAEMLAVPPTVIALWDVIEHFQDVRASMKLLADLAAPGCHLVLTTGNIASAYARFAGKNWRLMTPLEHYSYFAPLTITRLLEDIGFRVVAIKSPWKWVPLCLIVNQLERMGRLPSKTWKRVPPSWSIPLSLGDVMFVQAIKQ